MFNFLNTAILAAAAAALLPFLLHMFSKRKVKVVPFSSIAYLKAMQKNQVRAIKIKQLLLLVIRTLIVLAIVMAFARPATTGGYLGSHASVSAVIIIDNSASMGFAATDGLLFEMAKKKALDIIDMFGPSDEVSVIATNGLYATPTSENAFGNAETARSILDDAELTDSKSDIGKQFSSATQLLEVRTNLNREVYIISDFQQSGLGSLPETNVSDIKTFLVDIIEGELANNGIIDIDLGNQLIEVGTEFPVTAEIKSFYSEGQEDVLVSLYLDGQRVSQDGIRLNSGEAGSILFPLMVTTPGYHSGAIVLSDDDLLVDNIRHFSFYIPDNFNIMIVGAQEMDARLVNLALAPDEKLRRHWSVTRVSYQRLASARLSEYDVIVLINNTSLPSGDVNRLKNYVRNGGGLFVNVGQKADSAAFNNQFSELTGITLTSEFPRQFSRSGFYVMHEFDLEHPVFSIFAGEDFESGPSFKTYAIVRSKLFGETPPRILARFSDGSPAISAGKYGRGRVMYMGCDLNPDISDISLHPLFVPFLVRSSEYLSSGFTAGSDVIVTGDAPGRAIGKDFSISNEFTLIMPDSSRRIVAAEIVDDIKTIACGQLDLSGIYHIMNGNTESDRMAVNIPAEEGDLYRSDWSQLESRFGASRMPSSVELAGFIAEQRFGRELWHYFIIGAIILMMLEMIIARDKGAPLTEE